MSREGLGLSVPISQSGRCSPASATIASGLSDSKVSRCLSGVANSLAVVPTINGGEQSDAESLESVDLEAEQDDDVVEAENVCNNNNSNQLSNQFNESCLAISQSPSVTSASAVPSSQQSERSVGSDMTSFSLDQCNNLIVNASFSGGNINNNGNNMSRSNGAGSPSTRLPAPRRPTGFHGPTGKYIGTDMASGFPDLWSPSSEGTPVADQEFPVPVRERGQKVKRQCSLDLNNCGDVENLSPALQRLRERKNSTVFDDLLFAIYDRWHYRGGRGDSFDSDTYTDLTESDAFQGRGGLHAYGGAETDCGQTDAEASGKALFNEAMLKTKGLAELKQLHSELAQRINQISASLVKQLKRRNRRLATAHNNCDVITAILHASSLKRRVDSKIKFSIEPLPGDDAFNQWKDAMKAVARLPLGIPPEFRKKVWLALADNYLNSLCIDWEKTTKFAFNEKSNPDDNKLGLQIVKDLHRTGCSGFSGSDNDEDRAILKRVLLAYARWNKHVGYCQGFNVLAALILDVMDRKEDSALKVMIFLVDKVLPESYFANNLRALSVDMAVFRDLLHQQLPSFSKHLLFLQNSDRDQASGGGSYEPPLTNVFTMQWFLTLFATCLAKSTALRVWDSVLLEGSEILLRTSIAIWGMLQRRIADIQSADEFYSTMGLLSQEMLDGRLVNADELMKTVYSMAPFPFPQLAELREKYTYNITPFTAAAITGSNRQSSSSSAGGNGSTSGGHVTSTGAGHAQSDDEWEDEEVLDNINCFAGFFPQSALPSNSLRQSNAEADRSTESSSDISKVSPGAYASHPEVIPPAQSANSERITLDIDMLHKQYKRLKHRQTQAHIIFAAANARNQRLNMSAASATPNSNNKVSSSPVIIAPPIESPVAVNHLFVGREMLNVRNRTVVRAATAACVGYYSNDQKAGKNGSSTSVNKPDNNTTISAIKSDFGRRSASIDSSSSAMSDVASTVSSVSLGMSSDLGGDSGSDTTVDARSCWEETDIARNSDVKDSNNDNFKEEENKDDSASNGPKRIVSTECGIVHDSITQETTAVSGEPAHQDNRIRDQGKNEPPPWSPINKTKSSSNCGNGMVSSHGLAKLNSFDSSPNKDLVAGRSPSEKDFGVATRGNAFNPFPKQHINYRRARNGLRLGLYSMENVTKIEPSPVAKSFGGDAVTRIGTERMRRDACLHHQYLISNKTSTGKH